MMSVEQTLSTLEHARHNIAFSIEQTLISTLEQDTTLH